MVFNQDDIKVPYSIIEWALRTDNIRVLAYWLKVKRIYKEGHIHSIKSCKGISRNTASKYLRKLVSIGLIRLDSVFGYQCISLKKASVHIAGYKGNLVVITLKNTSIGDIIRQLRSMVVKSHLARQQYRAKEKERKLAESRASVHVERKLNTPNGLAHNAITLSDFTCGRYFYMSHATGRRIKQWMKQHAILKLTNQLPIRVSEGLPNCEENFTEEKERLYYKDGFFWKMQAQIAEYKGDKYNPFVSQTLRPKISTKTVHS